MSRRCDDRVLPPLRLPRPLARGRAIRTTLLRVAVALLVLMAAATSSSGFAGFSTSGHSHPENAGGVAVTVELESLSGVDEHVSYALSGSADEGVDYTISPASPLLIPAGQASAELIITPVNDVELEPNEDVVIDLDTIVPWWNAGWRYRAHISVDATTEARIDHIAEVGIDFTALLGGLGSVDPPNLDSLRVVEVDIDGNVTDSAVPFQFDPDPGFDPVTAATGTLILQMVGTTAASEIRDYYIYFDTALGFTAAVVTPQVVFTDDVMDEGQLSYEIVTTNASYYYHKLGGGFSSLVDADGNDWVGYHETGGANGNYRGIPNLTHTAGMYHPGLTTSVTSFLGAGPLRASFESASADESWLIRWDIYPTHARLRVLSAPEAYWFLYEGAPGGSMETTSDFVVRADGTQTLASVSWDGDLVGEEWFYVADPVVGRSIYFVNHAGDTSIDSYWQLSGSMTVLGFGRLGKSSPLAPQLTGVPRDFTLGLIDETAHANAAGLIRGATTDLAQTLGAAEDRDLQPITTFTLTLLDAAPAVPGLGGLAQMLLGLCLSGTALHSVASARRR